MPPGPAPRLLRAFHAARYAAGPTAARIGRRCPALDALCGRQGSAFITAWNPGGRRIPEGLNRRAGLALQDWLRRVPYVAGAGTGRGWREEHWFASLDARRAAVLARRFRQAAIVTLRPGQAARLVLLPRRPWTPG